MSYEYCNALLSEYPFPQSQVLGAGLPTPPEEDSSSTDAMFLKATRTGLEATHGCLERNDAHNVNVERQLTRVGGMRYGWAREYEDETYGQKAARGKDGEEERVAMHRLRQERDDFAHRVWKLDVENGGLKNVVADSTDRYNRLIDGVRVERQLWKSHFMEQQLENQQLRHAVYANALSTVSAGAPISSGANNADRSETRSLRQQLAYMDERYRSVTDKMAKLQEQTSEARRMLAQERQERLEERNSQLTVVVAKHGLERRMRNREQDLQAEWRRNGELSEKCRKLEDELAKAKEAGHHHRQSHELPLRGLGRHIPTIEPPPEDDWTDRPGHLPPEFGYSKFVRWKKRAREGYDHSSGNGKKQRRTAVDTGRLQLAGSESPPHVMAVAEQAASGGSAIDHMIHGEFTESESPSRAATPPTT